MYESQSESYVTAAFDLKRTESFCVGSSVCLNVKPRHVFSASQYFLASCGGGGRARAAAAGA